jgi:hypothetical protein
VRITCPLANCISELRLPLREYSARQVTGVAPDELPHRVNPVNPRLEKMGVSVRRSS